MGFPLSKLWLKKEGRQSERAREEKREKERDMKEEWE